MRTVHAGDYNQPRCASFICAQVDEHDCNFAYSARACLKIGMLRSASFYRVRKSW
jgi:hypothetical protein